MCLLRELGVVASATLIKQLRAGRGFRRKIRILSPEERMDAKEAEIRETHENVLARLLSVGACIDGLGSGPH